MRNHILLVEDDIMIASGITYALEMEGYEICHAMTVVNACNFIEKRKFELVTRVRQWKQPLYSWISVKDNGVGMNKEQYARAAMENTEA